MKLLCMVKEAANGWFFCGDRDKTLPRHPGLTVLW